MEAPLVSVCIPTFNGSKFLIEALESLKCQTFKDFEVILSDDDSKDNTLNIVEEFSKQVNFPITIYNHRPNGIGANWNNCLKIARGKYVKFLFQDDILFPTCIEKLIFVLKQNKSLGLVSCKRKFLLEETPSEQLKNWIEKYKNLQEGVEFPGEEITLITKRLFRSDQFFKSPLNKIGEPSAILFKKSILREVGLFREDLEQVLDYEFYYRVLKQYKIAVLNEELIGFRIHAGQATNVNRYRNINDYEKYDQILYEDFFWYLNRSQRKRLLSKYNKTYKLGIKIINAAKRRF